MKRITTIIIAALIVLSLSGCGDGKTNRTQSNKRGTLEIMYEDGYDRVEVYTDPQTHTQYIIWEGSNQGGITPRLNEDGTICVDKN